MVRRKRITDAGSTAENFADLRSDYNAARSSRFRRTRTGVSIAGASADFHYRNQSAYLRMMELARDMDRNDCIVGQTVDRAVANTLQDGIQLAPQTGDEGLNKELSDRWLQWGSEADQCDLAGELTWWDIEELALRQSFVDGDVVVLPHRDGALKMVEAHRVRTPTNTKRNVVHGVLMDEYRKHLEYWISKDDVDPSRALRLVSEIHPYPVRDEEGNRQVFHVMVSKKRISQTRGVTAFAPIIDLMGQFEDINFAKLIQQQAVTCFAIFEELDLGAGLASGGQQTGEQTTETLSDGSERTLEGMSPGMRIRGAPGVKLRMDSPNVPNPEFFPHVRLILTLVGINLGMPLVLVLLDASETNFSGWRGAVDQARLGFKRNQRRLVIRLHRPVYHWKVRQWMADDPTIQRLAEKKEINVFGHAWNPPGWPYIEPLKDATADLLRTRNPLTSQRRRCHERGLGQWNILSEEITADNGQHIANALEKAAELNKKYPGAGITWRDVASLPTADGVKLTMNPDNTRDSSGEKPSEQKKQEPAHAA